MHGCAREGRKDERLFSQPTKSLNGGTGMDSR